MPFNPRTRSLLLSILFLGLSVGVTAMAFLPETKSSNTILETTTLNHVERSAIDRFAKQHPERIKIVKAWEDVLPQLAEEQRLSAFLRVVAELPNDRVLTATSTPAALSLLMRERLPMTHQLLEKHGTRAWRMLLLVSHVADREPLERLAELLLEDDLALDVCETLGPSFALMFLPPRDVGNARTFPLLTRHVWRTMTPLEAAGFLQSYHRVSLDLLERGTKIDDLVEASNRFRALPELTRELCLDHPRSLQLLLERSQGVEVLRRCGPEAAEVLFGAYDLPKLKRPAMAVLAGMGLKGMAALDRLRKHEPFLNLLRRADNELLDGPQPLVVDAVTRVVEAADPPKQIEQYLKTPNLAGVLAMKRLPPHPAEDVLEFVPGYKAYRTTKRWSDGDYVSGGDVTLAALDAADTVMVVKNVLVKAGRSVATRLARRGAIKGTANALDEDALKTLDVMRARHGDVLKAWPHSARKELQGMLAKTPGWSAALAGEMRKGLHERTVRAVLDEAAPVARRVGLTLWTMGDGPLVGYDGKGAYFRESGEVGALALVLLTPSLPAATGEKETPRTSTTVTTTTQLTAEATTLLQPRMAALLILATVLALLALPSVRTCLMRLVSRRPKSRHEPLHE